MDESTEQKLVLARSVVDAAQREMWGKARRRIPAIRFGALAGTLGLLATASTYRLNVLLLEKKLPPEAAALVAAAAYSGGAGCAALVAARRWRGLPAPLPTETARQVAEILADSKD
ncbi:phage holin family protein [Actinomadura sp. 9N407]|uniref:phage holin family protein n=1 Tax=Actinomadura sp. 9N407 TaxID=3375154 RepID=UPI003790FB44